MRDSILAKIFRRVQVNDAEGRVLRAILSKANSFGKHAKVAYECLAAITGYSMRHVKRLVKSLIVNRRLLRVAKRVLWPGHNAINLYDVVIPWRRDASWRDVDFGRPYPPCSYRGNDKGDTACHPNTHHEEKSPAQPAQTCSEPASEKVASTFWTHGSSYWYYAQGITPPWEEAENGKKGSIEG